MICKFKVTAAPDELELEPELLELEPELLELEPPELAPELELDPELPELAPELELELEPLELELLELELELEPLELELLELELEFPPELDELVPPKDPAATVAGPPLEHPATIPARIIPIIGLLTCMRACSPRDEEQPNVAVSRLRHTAKMRTVHEAQENTESALISSTFRSHMAI